jgi:hypothetical protein
MRKRWAFMLIALFVAAVTFSFQGASAGGCANDPGDEGNPSVKVGSECIGVYYCVDLVKPYSCDNGHSVEIHPTR